MARLGHGQGQIHDRRGLAFAGGGTGQDQGLVVILHAGEVEAGPEGLVALREGGRGDEVACHPGITGQLAFIHREPSLVIAEEQANPGGGRAAARSVPGQGQLLGSSDLPAGTADIPMWKVNVRRSR